MVLPLFFRRLLIHLYLNQCMSHQGLSTPITAENITEICELWYLLYCPSICHYELLLTVFRSSRYSQNCEQIHCPQKLLYDQILTLFFFFTIFFNKNVSEIVEKICFVPRFFCISKMVNKKKTFWQTYFYLF